LQNFTRWQFVFKVAIYLFFEFFSFEKKSKILKKLSDSILSLAGSQKYTIILDFFIFFVFSYYHKIQLNHLMDDCHFIYITKLGKKKEKKPAKEVLCSIFQGLI